MTTAPISVTRFLCARRRRSRQAMNYVRSIFINAANLSVASLPTQHVYSFLAKYQDHLATSNKDRNEEESQRKYTNK
jgi:hypothetical protein